MRRKIKKRYKLYSSTVAIDNNRVKKVIRGFRNNIASGPGRIQVELVKKGIEKLFMLITQLYDWCINGEEVPDE